MSSGHQHIFAQGTVITPFGLFTDHVTDMALNKSTAGETGSCCELTGDLGEFGVAMLFALIDGYQHIQTGPYVLFFSMDMCSAFEKIVLDCRYFLKQFCRIFLFLFAL